MPKTMEITRRLIAAVLLSSLALSSPFPASAEAAGKDEDCATLVDFSGELGPIRDQQRSGWCFAFAAADMIGHFNKITPGERVSALDLASHYFMSAALPKNENYARWMYSSRTQGPDTQSLDGKGSGAFGKPLAQRRTGFFAASMEIYAKRGGLCFESAVPSDKSVAFANADKHLVEYLKTLEGVPFTRGSEELRLRFNELGALRADAAINRQCGARATAKPMKVNVVKLQDSLTMSFADYKLNDLLDQRTPIGIEYSACFLWGKPATVLNRSAECAHASVVVGRRKGPVTGKCEYKVRNSWGAKCSSYSKSIQDERRCDGGHVWITADEFKHNVRGLLWLTAPE